jgi:hypothetical protein
MKGDITFTVFRHKRPREAMSSSSINSFGSNASINQSGVVAGVDAVVVEKPRHCLDGESVQVQAAHKYSYGTLMACISYEWEAYSADTVWRGVTLKWLPILICPVQSQCSVTIDLMKVFFLLTTGYPCIINTWCVCSAVEVQDWFTIWPGTCQA